MTIIQMQTDKWGPTIGNSPTLATVVRFAFCLRLAGHYNVN